jgi:hypothetical protein
MNNLTKWSIGIATGGLVCSLAASFSTAYHQENICLMASSPLSVKMAEMYLEQHKQQTNDPWEYMKVLGIEVRLNECVKEKYK